MPDTPDADQPEPPLEPSPESNRSSQQASGHRRRHRSSSRSRSGGSSTKKRSRSPSVRLRASPWDITDDAGMGELEALPPLLSGPEGKALKTVSRAPRSDSEEALRLDGLLAHPGSDSRREPGVSLAESDGDLPKGGTDEVSDHRKSLRKHPKRHQRSAPERKTLPVPEPGEALPWLRWAVATASIAGLTLGAGSPLGLQALIIGAVGLWLLCRPPKRTPGGSANWLLGLILMGMALPLLPIRSLAEAAFPLVIPGWQLGLLEADGSFPATLAVSWWPVAEALASAAALAALLWQFYAWQPSNQQVRQVVVGLALGTTVLSVTILVRVTIAGGGAGEPTATPGIHPDPAVTGLWLGLGALFSLTILLGESYRFGFKAAMSLAGLMLQVAAILTGGFLLGLWVAVVGATVWYGLIRKKVRFALPVRFGLLAGLAAAWILTLSLVPNLGPFRAQGPIWEISDQQAYAESAILIGAQPLLGATGASFEGVLRLLGNAAPLNASAWPTFPHVLAKIGLPTGGLVLFLIILLFVKGLPMPKDGVLPFRLILFIAGGVLLVAAFLCQFDTDLAMLGLSLLMLRMIAKPGQSRATWCPPGWALRLVGLAFLGVGTVWGLATLGLPWHSAVAISQSRLALAQALVKEPVAAGRQTANREALLQAATLSGAPASREAPQLLASDDRALSELLSQRLNSTMGDPEAVITAADALLALDPVNHPAYVIRASARIRLDREVEAQKDFAIARLLRPNVREVAFQEGLAWSTVNLERMEEAWFIALEGADVGIQTELFRRMLVVAKQLPFTAPVVGRLAESSPDLQFLQLQDIPLANFHRTMVQLIGKDPSLSRFSAAQRLQLGLRWVTIADVNEMLLFVSERAPQLSEGWFLQALALAQTVRYREAVNLAHREIIVPSPPLDQSLREQSQRERLLERFSDLTPQEVSLTSLRRALDGDDLAAAGAIARAIVDRDEQASDFARYWAGESARRSGDFAAAWSYWKPYLLNQLSRESRRVTPATFLKVPPQETAPE